jgi:hypothetical protein
MAIGAGTWSTVCVNAWLTGLIGVAGTLLGSVTTYLFQSRDAKRDQEFRREERLQQEQLNSCSAFAGALSELKQRLIALRFQNRRDPHGADTQKMATECDRAGASAETARFRVQLISGDPDLMALADAAFAALEPIRRAAFREGEPISSTPSEPPRLRRPLVSWLVPGPPRQRRLKGSVPTVLTKVSSASTKSTLKLPSKSSLTPPQHSFARPDHSEYPRGDLSEVMTPYL